MPDSEFRGGTQVLSTTPGALRALLGGLPDTAVRGRSPDEEWTVFDVVGHLVHGEKTDWIPRLRIVMSDSPDRTFEAFDRFAMFDDSAGKSLSDLLAEFAELRAANLEELDRMGISGGDLDRWGVHPEFGEVTARQLISTWVAHDLSHLAQIARIMAKHYRDDVGPWRDYLPILDR